ncbi:MAG TPA: D-TA family PLP-dependent enzyme [Verrucomicrobiae bacterium]
MNKTWYTISNVAAIPSPAVVVYPDRVGENIRRAITIIGDPQRLRPHIKTHKCGQIIRMHLELGVTKFKCATIAEAEMAASAGAKDILVATPLVGPNVQRFGELRLKFPLVQFSTICDSTEIAHALSALGDAQREPVRTYLDLNCGMNRTGIVPGPEALELYRLLSSLPGISAAGIHAYDGNIHEESLGARRQQFDAMNTWLVSFRKELMASALPVPNTVASGTPTFALHAQNKDRECSPGTYVFSDFGYQRYSDLDFQIAALVVTRVLSKPTPNRLCLDLGHKAIASENPQPRVQFLNLTEATQVMHSEEHLVIETPDAANWRVGDVLYGVPRHICPTIALHDFVFPVVNGVAGEPWPIEARRRKITI